MLGRTDLTQFGCGPLLVSANLKISVSLEVFGTVWWPGKFLLPKESWGKRTFLWPQGLHPGSCESLTGRWQVGIGVRVLVDDTVNEHLR